MFSWLIRANPLSMLRALALAVAGILLVVSSSQGQTPAPSAPAPAARAPAATTAPETLAMVELSPGVFQIGKLRLDKKARSVTFPGKLNMTKELVEYVLVTPEGSTHESVLTSDIQPTDLHFAMLLLGAKGSGLLAPQPSEAPPGQLDAEYLKKAPRLKGDNVHVTVKWTDKSGKDRMNPVEDWLINDETKKPAPQGFWVYTGSMFGADGAFLAQQLGFFISVVTNPAALINNPRKGNDNDRIWAVNEKAVPPLETPLEITISLLEGSTETK
jgi:hypothetical protein